MNINSKQMGIIIAFILGLIVIYYIANGTFTKLYEYAIDFLKNANLMINT